MDFEESYVWNVLERLSTWPSKEIDTAESDSENNQTKPLPGIFSTAQILNLTPNTSYFKLKFNSIKLITFTLLNPKPVKDDRFPDVPFLSRTIQKELHTKAQQKKLNATLDASCSPLIQSSDYANQKSGLEYLERFS